MLRLSFGDSSFHGFCIVLWAVMGTRGAAFFLFLIFRSLKLCFFDRDLNRLLNQEDFSVTFVDIMGFRFCWYREFSELSLGQLHRCQVYSWQLHAVFMPLTVTRGGLPWDSPVATFHLDSRASMVVGWQRVILIWYRLPLVQWLHASVRQSRLRLVISNMAIGPQCISCQ